MEAGKDPPCFVEVWKASVMLACAEPLDCTLAKYVAALVEVDPYHQAAVAVACCSLLIGLPNTLQASKP